MYHDNNKKVIETDDIEEITGGHVFVGKDGAKHFHATFKLREGAVVDDHPTHFHVTNGVEHRLLSIVPTTVPDISDAKEVKERHRGTK